MGARGPVAKPNGRAQGHRKNARDQVVVALPPPAEEKKGRAKAVPTPSPDWTEATKKQWREFWRSPLAEFAQSVDRPGIDRLFGMRDQHARAMEVVRETPAVKGSTGQVRVNPFADLALKLEGAMLKLEGELGLTPMARARLGIETKAAAATLADVQRQWREGGGGATDDVDPRTQVVKPAQRRRR